MNPKHGCVVPVVWGPDALKNLKRRVVEAALSAAAGNPQAASRLLGMTRGELLRLVRRLGLEREPRLAVQGPASLEADAVQVAATVVNISRGGAYVELAGPVPIDARTLTLRLLDASRQEAVVLTVRIIHVRRTGVGLAFRAGSRSKRVLAWAQTFQARSA